MRVSHESIYRWVVVVGDAKRHVPFSTLWECCSTNTSSFISHPLQRRGPPSLASPSPPTGHTALVFGDPPAPKEPKLLNRKAPRTREKSKNAGAAYRASKQGVLCFDGPIYKYSYPTLWMVTLFHKYRKFINEKITKGERMQGMGG